jgi:subtilisin family serine protease
LDYEASSPFKNPDQAQLFFDSLRASFANPGVKTDVLQLQLPTGNYVFWDYGTGANVNNGRFDLYSVESSYLNKATFGMGTRKTEIVSSPGNAKNAITVGSFDFRSIWENTLGETTLFNLLVGGASSYTSAGFRRDGVVKPDTIAPGRYTISSLSHDAQPITGGCKISMATGDGVYFTKDGNHLAWEGTSASSPFTAGVIALILQKNPTLDSEQIRQILKRSAKLGGTIGAVPNPIWGWGMIDPEAAIKATPLRNRTPSQKKP